MVFNREAGTVGNPEGLRLRVRDLVTVLLTVIDLVKGRVVAIGVIVSDSVGVCDLLTVSDFV